MQNKRLTFGCEFQTEKNESRARFQVTWFELSPLKQINRTHVLKGFERSAKIFSDDLFTGKSLFSLGATVSPSLAFVSIGSLAIFHKSFRSFLYAHKIYFYITNIGSINTQYTCPYLPHNRDHSESRVLGKSVAVRISSTQAANTGTYSSF